MFIETIITCWNYSDFLSETLDSVVTFADSILIVTHPDDRATRSLCSHRGVRCEPTTVWTRRGNGLDKAAAINHGLRHLAMRDWVCHLDADIWLSPQSRGTIEDAELDPACIYGISRVNCVSPDEWDRFRSAPWAERPPHYLVAPYRGWPVGSILSHGAYGGYVPIGFFQLWHPATSGVRTYPEVQAADGTHTDVLFAVQGHWSARAKRVHLPEIMAVHLVSRDSHQGHNWRGRKSAPFRSDAGTKAGEAGTKAGGPGTKVVPPSDRDVSTSPPGRWGLARPDHRGDYTRD